MFTVWTEAQHRWQLDLKFEGAVIYIYYVVEFYVILFEGAVIYI